MEKEQLDILDIAVAPAPKKERTLLSTDSLLEARKKIAFELNDLGIRPVNRWEKTLSFLKANPIKETLDTAGYAVSRWYINIKSNGSVYHKNNKKSISLWYVNTDTWEFIKNKEWLATLFDKVNQG